MALVLARQLAVICRSLKRASRGALMRGTSRKLARNRAILLAHIKGQSVQELAHFHGLAALSIRAIISFERHRVSVSPEAQYCALRDSIDPALWMSTFGCPLDND